MIRTLLISLLVAVEPHPQRAVVPEWCYCIEPVQAMSAKLEADTRVELISTRGSKVKVIVLDGEYRGFMGYIPFANIRIDP